MNNGVQTQIIKIEYKIFYIAFKNKSYKIKIEKSMNNILLIIENYLAIINLEKLSELTNIKFNSIDNAYEMIIHSFKENEVYINDIENELIKLSLILINDHNEIHIILNKYNNKKRIGLEENQIKNNILNNKKYHLNPKDINSYIELVDDSYSYVDLDNALTIFKAINGIMYIIYTTMKKNIVCFNLYDNKKIIQIKIEESEYITNFRHYFDKNLKRDLIMTLCWQKNNLKIWNFLNWEIIININKVYDNGHLTSGYFLNDKNQTYFITANCQYFKPFKNQFIKIYDFNGNIINQINNLKVQTLFIDVYYDQLLSKEFIILCCFDYIISYDYSKKEIYYKYYDNKNEGHLSYAIDKNGDITKLIESCNDGNIRIWNFHSGILLSKTKVSDRTLYGVCIWDKNYLFVACGDKTIKLIDLKNNTIIKSLFGFKNEILLIKKIEHPEYGESLICQGLINDTIKLLI